jgi:PAS domain-containing protein
LEGDTPGSILRGICEYGLIALSIALALLGAYPAAHPPGRSSVIHTLSWIALWWRRGRRSEERAELSFAVRADVAPAILWTAQPDGSVDFISDTLYQFTGLTRERAMGWGWADAVDPDDVAVCKSKWEHSLCAGQSLGMVTVGVAELPQHGASAKELLEAADAALYRAKREGRAE